MIEFLTLLLRLITPEPAVMFDDPCATIATEVTGTMFSGDRGNLVVLRDGRLYSLYDNSAAPLGWTCKL